MSARTRSVFHNLVVVRYREVVYWDEVMERALKSVPGRLPAGADRIVGAIRSGVRRIERLTPLPTLRSPIVARYTPHAVEGRGVGNCYCADD